MVLDCAQSGTCGKVVALTCQTARPNQAPIVTSHKRSRDEKEAYESRKKNENMGRRLSEGE